MQSLPLTNGVHEALVSPSAGITVVLPVSVTLLQREEQQGRGHCPRRLEVHDVLAELRQLLAAPPFIPVLPAHGIRPLWHRPDDGRGATTHC